MNYDGSTYPLMIPRMPRTESKRSITKAREHVRKLEEKCKAEAEARQLAERQLRVLRRVRFHLDDQPWSVRASLKLINHTSP